MNQYMLKKWRKILLPKMSKSRWLWTGLLTLGLLLFVGQTAQAAGMAGDIANGLISFFARLMTELARIFIALSIFFLEFFLKLAQYNGYVRAGVVELGWLMVRDVANMFFVVVLLAIAFGTILGIESYQWNKMLIKFILAAVFINFSKLISGLIIDFAHVFTITFLNAIMATAGGNLIEMFKLDSILKFVSQSPTGPDTSLRWEVLGAAVMALIFAIFAAFTIGAYLIVMAARVVVLWVLIILSPLAFIMQIMPQTQEYAKKWWDKFTKQVMVAPVMVFFLWLAFATLSSANTLSQMGVDFSGGTEATKLMSAALSTPKLSLTEVSTWENMAHFMIAMAFLIVGINVVQGMGVVAGGLVQKAQGFAGSVAKIATGYAAGRWLAKEGGKGAIKHAPWVGTEKWKTRAKTQWESMKDWYTRKGIGGPQTKADFEAVKALEEKKKQLGETDATQRVLLSKNLPALEQKVEGYNIEGAIDDKLSEKEKNEYNNSDTTAKRKRELEDLAMARTLEPDKFDEYRQDRDQLGDARARLGETDAGKRTALEQEVKEEETKLQKRFKGGLFDRAIGRLAAQDIKTSKRYEKTKKKAENSAKLLWKRTGSEAGGYLPLKGQQRTDMTEAQDRIERGWLQTEEMRSKAKDEEYETFGKHMSLSQPRFKNGAWEDKKGSLAEVISRHKLGAQHWENAIKGLEAEARMKIIMDFKREPLAALKNDIRMLNTQLTSGQIGGREITKEERKRLHDEREEKEKKVKELETQSGVTYEHFLETQSLTKLKTDKLSAHEEGLLHDRLAAKIKNGLDIDKAATTMESGYYADTEEKKVIDEAKARADAAKEESSRMLEVSKEIGEKIAEMRKRQVELKRKQAARETLEQDDTDFLHAFDNKIKEYEKKLNGGDKVTDKEVEGAVQTIKLAEDDVSNAKENKATIEATIGKNLPEIEKKIIDELLNDKEKEQWIKFTTGKSKTMSLEGLENRQELEKEINEYIELKDAENKVSQKEKSLQDTTNGQYEKVGVNRLVLHAGKQREAAKEELKDKQGKWGKMADRLRGGDVSVAREVIGQLQRDPEQNRTAIDYWTRIAEQVQQGGADAWSYGAAKAQAQEDNRLYSYGHNNLLSEAEQRVIHDKRGVDTPNSALTELIEQFTKDFKEMTYDEVVSNAATMMMSAVGKVEKGTFTDADKATLAGFFKHAFDQSWIDDFIIGIMSNTEARDKIGGALGWRDAGWDPGKIRDVEMLVATGNLNWAKENVVVSEIIDEVLNSEDEKLRMSYEQFVNGLRTGVFKNQKGEILTNGDFKKMKSAVQDNLAVQGRVLSQEQNKVLESLLDVAEGAEANAPTQLAIGKEKSRQFIDNYLHVLRDNQAALQFLGNLRDEAIRKGHYENAGHSLNMDIGDGERLFVNAGVRSARDHVYGDVNKIDANMKSKANPHVVYDMGVGEWGQISDNIRLKELSIARGGIVDPNRHGGTQERYVKHTLGISAQDDYSDFTDQQGYFKVGASDRQQKFAKFKAGDEWNSYKEKNKGVDENKLAQVFAARRWLKQKAVPYLERLPYDFLMTLAQGTGVDKRDAISNGTMRLRIPVLENGELIMKPINNVKDFIRSLKTGELGVKAQVPDFKPAISRPQKGGGVALVDTDDDEDIS